MSTPRILVYGSYGYTGDLIARLAQAQGIEVLLAGRNAARLEAQSQQTGHPFRAFSLDDPGAAQALQDVDVVIHCAGPFLHTYRQMAALCVQTQTHYTDITGEAAVFEGLAAMDEVAIEAGIMLLPGTGFDVVPSDCLANHVHARLPDATHLELAFRGVGGGVSHGTATTMAENVAAGGLARIHHELKSVPTAWRSRRIPFSDQGSTTGMTIPWGDVVTAWHSTGIPNVHVYTEVPALAPLFLKLVRPFVGLLGWGPVQRWIKRRIDAAPAGPSDAVRERSHSELWAEARNANGQVVQSRLRTLEGYTLTAEAALAIASRIVDGDHKPGFQTPARVYGKDLVLDFGDSTFTDIT